MIKSLSLTILWTLVLGMIIFPTASQAQLEESFEAKRDSFEKLWNVSMNRTEVEELTGEIHADRWDLIRPKNNSIKEVAALIVRSDETREIHLININMGTKAAGTISFSKPPGYTVLGRFHTHPYEYESLKNMPFSTRDLVDLYISRNKAKMFDGFFSLIKSGEKYYALVIEDVEMAMNAFKEKEALAKTERKTLFDYMYKKFYEVKKGSSIQEVQMNSLISITVPGIAIYETIDGDWRRLN